MLTIGKIKEFAKALNVDIIGFSHFIMDAEYTEKVQYQETNNYLYPRKNMPFGDYNRVDKLINNPRLIISIGISYHNLYVKNEHDCFGYYSKSSYGVDYHTVIYQILEKIGVLIKEYHPNSEYYTSCDTKIIDDRHYAYLTGNGYYGKNTMIINDNYGSEVFYGTLVSDVELDFVQPKVIVSKCNECNLCEEACPSASLSNYVLDYKSCLSYLTQTKTMIPSSILAHRLYGCDTCNNVCPKNRLVQNNMTFIEDYGFLNLFTLIRMSKSEYKNILGDKGLSWLNPTIIKKNAILNLELYLDTYFDEILKLYYEVKQNNATLLVQAFEFIFLKRGVNVDKL